MRHLMHQLSEHSSNVLPVYVNCWENSTQLSVYNRIVEEMRLPLPRRGLGPDEIFDRIIQFVKNYKKPILLILDELDGMRHEELLYVVSRANEKFLSFGIIGISNDRLLLSKFDPRVRSSLHFSDLEFKPYSEDQLLSILKLRAEHALLPNTYDEKLLLKIARSVDDGSARVAIERLWKSAKHAENSARSKIMLQDLEDIISSSASFKLPELNLCPEESLILTLLKNAGGELRATDLYGSFTEKIPKSKRHIRNYLNSLEQKGLVGSRELSTPSMFKLKVFWLKERK